MIRTSKTVGTVLSAAVITGVAASTAWAANPTVVPIRAVPGVPRAIAVCSQGDFVQDPGGPNHGTVTVTGPGFVYTSDAKLRSGTDVVNGHCASAPASLFSFKITIAPKAPIVPNPVTVTYSRTCSGDTGTVVFHVVNNDTRRHRVEVGGQGLTPPAQIAVVPAGGSGDATFTIGSSAVTALASVNNGRPSSHEIDGCGAGEPPVESGTITPVTPGVGPDTGGGYLAMHSEAAGTVTPGLGAGAAAGTVLVGAGTVLALRRRASSHR